MDQKSVIEIEVPVLIINIAKDQEENTVFENVSIKNDLKQVLLLNDIL